MLNMQNIAEIRSRGCFGVFEGLSMDRSESMRARRQPSTHRTSLIEPALVSYGDYATNRRKSCGSVGLAESGFTVVGPQLLGGRPPPALFG